MMIDINLILTHVQLTLTNPLTLEINSNSFFGNLNFKLVQNVLESFTLTTYKTIKSTSNAFTATVTKPGMDLSVFVILDLIACLC